MERLTDECWKNLDPWECCGQDKFCTRGCHDKGGCTNGCIVPKVYCRLAKYEDIGLTPEQIREVDKLYTEKCEELAKYKKLEEQGLLLQLPCECGDDVYIIPSKVNYDLNVLSKHEEKNRVYHQRVERITLDRNGWYVECDKDVEYGTGRICIEGHFGITWFLTKEEAEAALKNY